MDACSGSITSLWRFQGRILESASGATDLYDFSARSYDPTLGAFTSFDSVSGSAQNPLTLNRYLYANANPATLVDPDGHMACTGGYGGQCVDYAPCAGAGYGGGCADLSYFTRMHGNTSGPGGEGSCSLAARNGACGAEATAGRADSKHRAALATPHNGGAGGTAVISVGPSDKEQASARAQEKAWDGTANTPVSPEAAAMAGRVCQQSNGLDKAACATYQATMPHYTGRPWGLDHPFEVLVILAAAGCIGLSAGSGTVACVALTKGAMIGGGTYLALQGGSNYVNGQPITSGMSAEDLAKSMVVGGVGGKVFSVVSDGLPGVLSAAGARGSSAAEILNDAGVGWLGQSAWNTTFAAPAAALAATSTSLAIDGPGQALSDAKAVPQQALIELIKRFLGR
jgi:RHS repeat-associated protein